MKTAELDKNSQTSKRTRARKLPSQNRSKETLERILEAAQTIMQNEGYDRLNTAHIAKEAGVSVGSLYQYFPNKESILRSLAERWLFSIRLLVQQREPSEAFTDFEVYKKTRASDLMEVAMLFKNEKGLLPLLDAMKVNADLRKIDSEHDAQLIKVLTKQLLRANPNLTRQMAKRAAALEFELAHAGFSFAVQNPDLGFRKTVEDIIEAILSIEEKYFLYSK